MPRPKSFRRGFSRRLRRRQRVIALDSVPTYRLKFVFVILCLGLFGLVGRMACLQIFQASELEARARALQTHRTQPLGTRRTIVDRMGKLVALDEQKFRLWAHPRYFNFPGDNPSLVRTPLEVASKISRIIKINQFELINLIAYYQKKN